METQAEAPLDPEWSSKVRDKIVALARGNGIRAENVGVSRASGGQYTFQASTDVALSPRMIRKKMPGRVSNGTVVESESAAEAKLRDYIAELCQPGSGMRTRIRQVLTQRKDQGFGLARQPIALPFLRQDYVVHQTCGGCGQKGRVDCVSCHGHGKVTCTQCHGQREVVCTQCHGQRHVMTAQGRKPCSLCQSTGHMTCTLCASRGALTCRTCNASGSVPCRECQATGWFSIAMTAEIDGRTAFRLGEDDNMPDRLRRMIAEQGNELARSGEISLSALEDQGADKASTSQATVSVHYRGLIPYAEISMQLGKSGIEATAMGHNVRFVDMPPFLEKISGKAIKFLYQAAKQQPGGDVAGRLKHAARARMVRETLRETLKSSPRKAQDVLAQKYPVGLRATTRRNMALAADKALKKITYRPRLIGIAAGLGISAALQALYVFAAAGPLRALVPGPAGGAALDLLVALGGAAILTIAVQFTAARKLSTTLASILPGVEKQNILPGIGKTAFAAYPLIALTFIGLMEAARQTGLPVSEWYAQLWQMFS